MASPKGLENTLGKTAALTAEISNKALETDMECGKMFLIAANATRDITCSIRNTVMGCMTGQTDTSTKEISSKTNVAVRDNSTTTTH
jgi:hypothetical protein